ncbi:MAG: signal peptide peptidase SppA [Alphaproteobacteria bacterium]
MLRRNKRPLKPRPLFASPVPKNVEKPKIKWKVLPVVWQAMKRGAMVLGFLVLFSSFISMMILGAALQEKQVELPDQMVLVLDLKNGFREIPLQATLTNPFVTEELTLRHYLAAIEMAARDPRVMGIAARMREGSFNVTQTEELRATLKRFRETGKPAHIYSTSFGEAGGGLGRYYLAAAFDKIWMQPLGIITITGMSADVPHFREALDKLGVTPQFFKRNEHKTAYESLTDKTMSAENRAMLTQLIADYKSHLVGEIAADRNMSAQDFERLVDKGLLTADEALNAALIDHMDYADVMIETIKEDITGDPKDETLAFVSLEDYVAVARSSASSVSSDPSKPSPKKKKPAPANGVALIYAVGAIMTSDVNAQYNAVFLDGGIAASDRIAPAILDAAADESVRVIVLRVDSPGGSPAASEAILRALDRAQKQGKTVIVSMGSTAASGGYWIAAHADYIFVSETTVTGSIGVVGGKFVLNDLWDKIGVNWEGPRWGRNADLWSSNAPFDSAGSERVNAMLDNVYDHFLRRVAHGRKMSVEEVEKIAGGRIWTGKRAVEVGLADEVGGLLNALDHAAKVLELESRDQLSVQIFPRPKTPLEQFLEILQGERGLPLDTGGFQSMAMELVKPYARGALMARDPQNFLLYQDIPLQ